MYYIEIPQEVTKENDVALFHYLAQHFTAIPHVIQ